VPVALIRYFPAKPQGVLRPSAQLQLSHKNNNKASLHPQFLNEVKHETIFFSLKFGHKFLELFRVVNVQRGAAEFRILCTS
jgi:hypothetical protein